MSIISIAADKDALGFAGTVVTQVVTAGLAAWAIIRTRRRDSLERFDVPRAQIDLECGFFGPVAGDYIAEVRIIIDNKGHAYRYYKQIKITVRGLESGSKLDLVELSGLKRARFPTELFKDDGKRDYTIEPGIRQVLTTPVVIPSVNEIILIHVRLVPGEAVDSAPYYTEERTFKVTT